jgi:hypothetical protein
MMMATFCMSKNGIFTNKALSSHKGRDYKLDYLTPQQKM